VCAKKHNNNNNNSKQKKKQRVSETSFFLSLFWFFPVRFKAKKEGHEKHNKKKRALTKKKNEALSKKVSPQQTTATKKTNRIKRAFFEQKTCQKTTSFCIFVFPREREPRFSFFFAKKRGLPLLFCPSKRFLIECLVCCVFGEKKKLCSVFRVGLFFSFWRCAVFRFLPQAKKNEPKKEEKEKMTFQGCAVHFGRQRLFLLNLTRRKKKKVL
jgi:hypothetical protein